MNAVVGSSEPTQPGGGAVGSTPEPPRIEVLGLIAGNRSLPLMLARQARAAGVKRLVAVGFEGETEPGLADLVDELVWVRVGQLERMIRALRDRGVRWCVMAGQIAPKRLYEVRPDLRALTVLMRLKERNAHSIFGAVIEELRKDGIEVMEAVPWLRPLMKGPGYCLGPAPTPEQRSDIAFGFRMAREVARLEIGQMVVVKQGTVLAVEAFEGTDRCLLRAGELAGPEGGAVAVKVAKEGHDMRFDIPCVGPGTLETCARAGVAVFAFEAGRSLVLEEEACRELARRHKISFLTVDPASEPLERSGRPFERVEGSC
ncbi:MAG: UDP-2,3-diacylglucosamine diphosphatase LpxI [Verrucomicrobiota bacterium]|nr:UDP-2,3-diacylglucosamine diphosphatase LpxI [Limisphaera sp.]MDW8382275.1 UDP-2,3-diacylglucosamine diphosphatase LpxI [Verrucomicrobiota bacterium]